MAGEPRYNRLRTAAFKSILVGAFKAFPRRVEEILEREGWNTFVDFMAAVERSGRVLFQFQKEAVERRDTNTQAMFQLLSAAFYGTPDGELDVEPAREALESLEILSWNDLAHAVLEISQEAYAEETHGGSPLDEAKVPTLLFYRMRPDSDPHLMNQVVQAFGLATTRHLEAVLATFYAAEVTLEDLDRSVNRPELLTEIVDRAPSNPHKGIIFGSSGPVGPELEGERATRGLAMGSRLSETDSVLLLMDLDRKNRPGGFVAVKIQEWDSGGPVMEGWRGPEKESEDFARSRLEEVECGTILVDMMGYWDCIPPGIRVF